MMMSDETTTDRLAEIEEQAADYTPPEGWRLLQAGEVLQPGDAWAHPQADLFEENLNLTGVAGKHGYYLRRIEPEPQPADYHPPERWRVLQPGEVLEDEDWIIDLRDGNGCPTMKAGSRVGEHQVGEHQLYIRRITPEPEQIITPDDVAAEALRQKLEATEAALLEQQQRNEELVTQGSQQRMQIAELRSEVSHVQGLLGDSKRRVVELETLVADLRAVNAATEKAINGATRDKADLQHRLDVVSSEWALQTETIRGLESLLEAVKAELVQQAETARRLQIELDAREQVPQAVSDRFEEGWDAGTARAVEAIAEWTEPFRQMIEKADNLVESDRASRLCAEIMQALPVIMRSLTGLTDND